MVWKKTTVIIVILLAAYLAVRFFSVVETYQSDSLTPQTIPAAFKGWESKEVPVGEVEKKFLPEDTMFVKRYYQKPSVGTVYMVVVFTGKDRRSIHRPEVCYPAQGWAINATRTESVSIEHPLEELKTKRLDISYGKKNIVQKEIVLYWFMGNNRVTAAHWKRVSLMGFDRCVYGKNYQWAFFRVSTPVTPKGEKAAENVIHTFVSDVFPVIAKRNVQQY